jgi:hypothetical protein
MLTVLSISGSSQPAPQQAQVPPIVKPTSPSLLEILTAATLVVLIWYTIETYKLRKAAQAQVETSMMPMVVVMSSRVPATSGIGEWYRLVIRNLGAGPALNVNVQPIPVANRLAVFEFSRMLAPGEDACAMIGGLHDVCDDGQGYINRRTISDSSSFRTALQACKDRTTTQGLITYTSASGKKFQTKFTILHDSSELDSFVLFNGMNGI